MAAVQKLQQNIPFLSGKILLTGQLGADCICTIDRERRDSAAVRIGI